MPTTDTDIYPADNSTAVRRCYWTRTAIYIGVVLVFVTGVFILHAVTVAPDQPSRVHTAPTAGAGPTPVAPQPVKNLAQLPIVDTFATVPAAPRADTTHLGLDSAPETMPATGLVVHPSTPVAIYSFPGGPALAVLPVQELGSDTWVPVIGQQPGWDQILLPSRPNGVTGWIYRVTTDTEATTPYRIAVNRTAFTLTLINTATGAATTWTIGVGKAVSPTPAGRTFLMASLAPTTKHYSPVILALGWHSATYLTYAGGPGTIGVHTWTLPTRRSIYGTQSSDGCIRVPPEALAVLETAPLGTPVLIH